VVLDRLPEDRRGHRRRHAVRAIAQSVLVAALLFAAFFLLPLNGAEAIGEVLTLVGGVLLVTLTLVWQIRKIPRGAVSGGPRSVDARGEHPPLPGRLRDAVLPDGCGGRPPVQ
jgi:hypothetical protein